MMNYWCIFSDVCTFTVTKCLLSTEWQHSSHGKTEQYGVKPFNSHISGTNPGWFGSRTLRNINPIYHLHCLQIPHKHSQPVLPCLPVCMSLASNTRHNPGDNWKKREESEDQNPHFHYICRRVRCTNARLTAQLAYWQLTLTGRLTLCRDARSSVN